MELIDWISALSSLASLIVAALATIIAWNVHKGEAKRVKQAEVAAEQGQANLVTAWETAHRIPDDEVDQVPQGALSEAQILDYGSYVHVTRMVMSLVNRSSQPVYDVKINADGTNQVFGLDILPPGEQLIGVPRYAVVDYSLGEFNENEFLLNISFRDAAGNWWVRKAKGALIKVTSETEHCTAMGPGFQEHQELLAQFKPQGPNEAAIP